MNLYKKTVAGSLVVATVLLSGSLLSGSVLLQPKLGGNPAERLAALDAAGARAGLSAGAFVLAQLPFLIGRSVPHAVADRPRVLGRRACRGAAACAGLRLTANC
jgi:hypothetical protein